MKKATDEENDPHRLLFLYSVRLGKRIHENADFRRFKCENHEQNRNSTENGDRDLGIFASRSSVVELLSFINIGNCVRNKEDRNVYPVGRLADNTVIGIKNDWYRYNAEQDTL